MGVSLDMRWRENTAVLNHHYYCVKTYVLTITISVPIYGRDIRDLLCGLRPSPPLEVSLLLYKRESAKKKKKVVMVLGGGGRRP